MGVYIYFKLSQCSGEKRGAGDAYEPNELAQCTTRRVTD